MLRWIHNELFNVEGEPPLNAYIIWAVVLVAWAFMYRASEYLKTYGGEESDERLRLRIQERRNADTEGAGGTRGDTKDTQN